MHHQEFILGPPIHKIITHWHWTDPETHIVKSKTRFQPQRHQQESLSITNLLPAKKKCLEIAFNSMVVFNNRNVINTSLSISIPWHRGVSYPQLTFQWESIWISILEIQFPTACPRSGCSLVREGISPIPGMEREKTDARYFSDFKTVLLPEGKKTHWDQIRSSDDQATNLLHDPDTIHRGFRLAKYL